MEKLLIWLAIIVIVIIIFKISDFIWRLVSLAVLVILVFAFKDNITAAISGFLTQLEAGSVDHWLDWASDWAGQAVDSAVDWLSGLLS